MTKEQEARLNKVIAESIEKNVSVSVEKTVNGKIKAIDAKLDTYIREDNEWKEDVRPTIDGMKRLQNASDVGLGLLKFIVVMGAAVTAIWGGVTYLLHK